MRIAGRTAVTRHMLQAPDDTCPAQSIQHRPAECGHLHRFGPESTVANHIVGLGPAHVEGRMVIDRNSHFCEFAAHGFCIGARCLDRGSRRDIP